MNTYLPISGDFNGSISVDEKNDKFPMMMVLIIMKIFSPFEKFKGTNDDDDDEDFLPSGDI